MLVRIALWCIAHNLHRCAGAAAQLAYIDFMEALLPNIRFHTYAFVRLKSLIGFIASHIPNCTPTTKPWQITLQYKMHAAHPGEI